MVTTLKLSDAIEQYPGQLCRQQFVKFDKQGKPVAACAIGAALLVAGRSPKSVAKLNNGEATCPGVKTFPALRRRVSVDGIPGRGANRYFYFPLEPRPLAEVLVDLVDQLKWNRKRIVTWLRKQGY